MTEFKKWGERDEEKISGSYRDMEYGLDEDVGVDITEEISKEEELKDVKESIRDESQTVEHDIGKDIDCADYLSKKEKKAVRCVVSKKINHLIKKFDKEAEEAVDGTGRLELEDIGTELDDELDKVKDAVNEMLDVDDYYENNNWKSNYDYEGDYRYESHNRHNKWPKRPEVGQTKLGKSYAKTPAKDYSKDIEEVESDRKIKIKVDKESLDAFLSESDGKNENIGMITADNREFTDIEDVTFKILKIEANRKKRQRAYIETDGKAISDFAQENNITKCGWIHTHPFTRKSTFFSGMDETTTKEMCVLPDDYCLAIVVACEYKEVENYMKGNRVVREEELFYNLGRMVYRKVQLTNEYYDGKTDTIEKKPGFSLVKYDCEIVVVDTDGNVVEEK